MHRLQYLIILLFLLLNSNNMQACLLHVVDKEFYKNGQVKLQVQYCGEWKEAEYYYSKNGDLVLEKFSVGWTAGWIGDWIKFNKDGKPTSKGNFIVGEDEDRFIDHPINGLYESDYPSKRPKLRVTFEDGFVRGKYVSYYETGQIFIMAEIWDGEVVGDLEYYTEDGHLYSASAKVGDYRHKWAYYPNGRIKEEAISLGYLKYVTRFFAEDGRILEELIVDPETQQLASRSYFGELRKADEIRHPSLTVNQGFVEYYINGNLRLSGQVKESSPFGKTRRVMRWQWFYENAMPKRIVDYNLKGRVNGLFKEWYANGQVARELILKAENALSAYVEYDSSGAVMRSISSKDLVSKFHLEIRELENYEMELVVKE